MAQLTLAVYLQGRDKGVYASEFTPEIQANAEKLLLTVNAFLQDLRIPDTEIRLNSGWRPAKHNKLVGGSPNSLHIVGRAIDLDDDNGSLAATILSKPELLTKYDLWLEDPNQTLGWVHLDNGERPDRPIRVFRP